LPAPLRLIASEAHQFPQLTLAYQDNAIFVAEQFLYGRRPALDQGDLPTRA
jgi:hypothetical protein